MRGAELHRGPVDEHVRLLNDQEMAADLRHGGNRQCGRRLGLTEDNGKVSDPPKSTNPEQNLS